MGIVPDIFSDRIEGPDGSHLDVMLSKNKEDKEEKEEGKGGDKEALAKRRAIRNKYKKKRI